MGLRHVTVQFLLDLKREVPRSLKQHRVRILLAAGLLLAFAAVGSVAGWQYANSASFCGSCHNMEPYVASWADSSIQRPP